MTNYKEQLEEAKTDLYNALIACRNAVADREFDDAQVAEVEALKAFDAIDAELIKALTTCETAIEQYVQTLTLQSVKR
jgi:hypothetical protein